MTNKNAKISQKVLAVFMSLLMVISVIPFSTVAWAATDEHPDAVTVTVKDEDGNLIKDATVDFTVKSSTDSSKDIAKTETTDEYGVVEILAADQFVADDLTLNATVKADGYFDGEIKDQVIESVDANYDVVLESTELKGVTIEARNDLTYTGEAQDLVSVTPNNYTVTYRVNGGAESSEAKGTDATDYTVEVNVTDGVKSTIKTVKARIAPAKTGIDIVAKTGLKYDDGRDMELVELTGEFLDTDDVTWSVNGFDTGSRVIPKAAAVTTADNPYRVKLTVDRGLNYEKFEKTVEVEIGLGEINLGDLEIKSKNNLVYNGDEQELLTVTGKGDYTLEYSFDENESKTWTTWDNDNFPKKTDAGTYYVYVKATKNGYADINTPAFPIAVTINQATQKIAFNKEDLPNEVFIDSNNSDNNVYDFSASGENISELSENKIKYELVGTISDDVAIISDDGKLTVKKAGIISIKASREGNNNYSGVEIGSTVIVKVSSNGLVYFSEDNLTYTLDTSGNTLGQEAHKKFSDDNGQLTYSLDESDIGLNIDEKSGKLTVSDFKKLTDKMAETGSISTTIIVDKTAGTKTTYVWYDLLNVFDTARTEVVYLSSQARYTLTISFLDTPENAYTLPAVDGENGWYKSKVTVTPATGYTIAKTEVTADATNFAASVDFDNQGTDTRYVYLKNDLGQITGAIPVDIKIDTSAPDANNMTVDIQDLNIIEKLGYKFGFYNPEVTIAFTVTDETESVESGMQKFTCYYTKDKNAVASIIDDTTWELTPELKDGKYIATKTIKASELETYRGYISFTATDKAGNESAEKHDKDNVIVVVDKINPVMNASFKLADVNGSYNPVNTSGAVQHYYDGSVDFTFTVNEQNFFSEDVIINVTKDGVSHPVNVSWSAYDDSDEVYYGKFTLSAPTDHSGDGDYVVTMSYQDKSKNIMMDGNGNEVEHYTSEVITIDTTNPTVKIEYIHEGNIQKTKFTVTEHNFRASDITVSGTMKDIKKNDIAFTAEDLTGILNEAEWTQDSENTDKYTFEYDGYIDGIYNLTMDYTDISQNPADSFIADEFIIDHTAPRCSNDIPVEIEIITSPLKTILGAITFGFYNPDVEVKFTTYDNASGVKDFSWDYTKENGASNINRPTDKTPTIAAAVPDENDKSKFTATIILPDTEAKELRGNIAVSATDNFENISKKIADDGNIIVVDHISPEISVEYSEASRTVGTKAYYNGDINIKFNVTEANFYAEDVKVTVAKNGGTPYSVDDQISWGNRDENDLTLGTMTLPAPADHSGDGHYIIHVEYADKSYNPDAESNNTVTTYTSNELTIDTIKPVIDVEYQNTNVVNSLKDTENHNRKYFDDTQTAVVTIKEHNFASDEVDFTIIAKDVTGKELSADSLNSKTDWAVDSTGDVHKIKITYPGDANYTFDVAYTDLATNSADDYAEDYFTVDKTAPTNPSVSYSTSVLDTVLESVTFGFYNAKMIVTLKAEDSTSEIHSFLYSYLNAAGVSGVNAELVKQTINAADIKYSDDRKTATTTFEIPKMVLANDNQFNGTVEFTATDRAGNESRNHKETKRIVVDNIAPTAKVEYSNPVNTVGDISYYDGNINATVTINEANFYANDVQVMVSKDGGTPTAVSVKWTNNSVDVHTGTFTLTEDGDYVVTINYRDKSSNAMTTYTSKLMTIDTKIEAPTYSINGVAKSENGGAYNGEATIAFNFEDQNYDTNTIELTRTRYNSVENVTDKFVNVSGKDKGGSGSFTIPSEVENDGIYVLKISMTDRAKHSVESQMKFTINRYGSVYEYSDYLVSLIKDGGQYIKIEGNNDSAITQDLVITEYNANQILEDSLKLLITRDGESVDAQYKSNPAVDSSADIGESGWYQYDYTIAKENFAEDGVYKITLASAYDTDDSENNDSASVPDNSIDEAENQILDAINFTVDTNKPEIRNIVNLDKAIVNAQTLNVKYTIVDVGGIKSIDVIVNGQKETITDFEEGGNAFNYTGEFTLNESSNAQTVQIVVTDLAGNVTDTASDEFKENHKDGAENGLYVFNDSITVSTNFFVRWYANKPLFWGSIGGVVVLTGLICFLVAFKRKKKETKEEK